MVPQQQERKREQEQDGRLERKNLQVRRSDRLTGCMDQIEPVIAALLRGWAAIVVVIRTVV